MQVLAEKINAIVRWINEHEKEGEDTMVEMTVKDCIDEVRRLNLRVDEIKERLDRLIEERKKRREDMRG